MRELDIQFTGRGEVKGFLFQQVKRSNHGYIYEVLTPEGAKWYEVFKRKENALFAVVSYPTSKGFGIWAWTYRKQADAEKRLIKINETAERHQGAA